MNKKLFIQIVSVALFLCSTSTCFAFYENMQTQSLSLDNNMKNASGVSQSFSYEKLPYNQIKQLTNDTDENTPREQIYIDANPYRYNNYNNGYTYQIGPYYGNRYFSTGGYNYSGFSYNYGSNKRPLYITTPPMPIQPPPPPNNMHQPKPPHNPSFKPQINTPPQNMQPPMNNGSGFGRPHSFHYK